MVIMKSDIGYYRAVGHGGDIGYQKSPLAQLVLRIFPYFFIVNDIEKRDIGTVIFITFELIFFRFVSKAEWLQNRLNTPMQTRGKLN